MPRVHQVKARKSYPSDGIEKGDTYFKWRIRTGRSGITHRSLKRPRQSDLTGSDKKARLYAAHEACEDLTNVEGGLKKGGLEDLKSAFEFGVSEAEEVQQEYDDAASACEGGLNEKFEAMSQAADEVVSSFQEAVDRMETIIDEIGEDDFDKDDLDGLLREAMELVGNVNVEIEV